MTPTSYGWGAPAKARPSLLEALEQSTHVAYAAAICFFVNGDGMDRGSPFLYAGLFFLALVLCRPDSLLCRQTPHEISRQTLSAGAAAGSFFGCCSHCHSALAENGVAAKPMVLFEVVHNYLCLL